MVPELTVALRLMPIVLIRTASEPCATTKNTQKIAVAKVLPAFLVHSLMHPLERHTNHAGMGGEGNLFIR